MAVLSPDAQPLALHAPGADRLERYVDALARGWSPDSTRDVSREQLLAIQRDPRGFLADLQGTERPLRLADGRIVPRLPGIVRWIDDGAFCGAINFRHQPGTEDLPSYCSGHIGYSIVAWKRGRGYATRALELMLPEARKAGLRRVLLTCDEDNPASQRVIEKCGGVRTDDAPPLHPGDPVKRAFWIAL